MLIRDLFLSIAVGLTWPFEGAIIFLGDVWTLRPTHPCGSVIANVRALTERFLPEMLRRSAPSVLGSPSEEQRLADGRRQHRMLKRFRNEKRRFRPFSRQKALWISGDEDDRDLKRTQQIIHGIQTGTSVRKR